MTEKKIIVCPICGSTDYEMLYGTIKQKQLRLARFNKDGIQENVFLRMSECHNCGNKFAQESQRIEVSSKRIE